MPERDEDVYEEEEDRDEVSEYIEEFGQDLQDQEDAL